MSLLKFLTLRSSVTTEGTEEAKEGNKSNSKFCEKCRTTHCGKFKSIWVKWFSHYYQCVFNGVIPSSAFELASLIIARPCNTCAGYAHFSLKPAF